MLILTHGGLDLSREKVREMTAVVRSYKLDVSEYYFRLTTESVRLSSNKKLSHCTISDVVNDRAARAKDLAACYEAADIMEHFRIIPSDGGISFEVTILETSASSIDESLPSLTEAIGRSVQFKDALSLMLHDLLVEANATHVLNKLGLLPNEAAEYTVLLKKPPTNVVPFK